MLFFIPVTFEVELLEVIKLKTFDALVSEQEPSGNFTILNLTEEDVDKEGGYPFPRKRLAEIQVELLEAGAIGVGWGMSFPHPDRLGGDIKFAESLRYTASVLPLFETNNNIYPKTTGTVIIGEDIGGYKLQGVLNNIPILEYYAASGIAVAQTDVDNLIRRLPLLMRTPDGWIASYGIEVLKVLLDVSTYIIKTNDNGLEEIIVQGLPPVSVDSLGRKWVSWVDTPQTTLQEMNVEGTFVFVGVTASGVMPQLATPIGLLEPHKIQAALAESILIQNSPQIPDYSTGVELLMLLASVVAVWVFINSLGITLGVFLSTCILILTSVVGVYFIKKGLLIDVTWTLICQFITGATAFYFRFREQYKLRQQVKKQFGKYLDPRMVKKLQDNPELCKVNGNRVDCSIIFTDLRGFTSLSESVEPEMVTYIMNNVLDVQVKAANKFFGCTDKFIGDAGMFHWNTIIPQPDHHSLALQAAKEIEANIIELNRKFKDEGIPEIAIGVGVNSGVCIAGNFGATDRFAFSLIGDPCNVAARLESSTKIAGVGTLIGEETAKYSCYELQELEPIEVKGKAKPLRVYTWK
ncbi:adenylate/guanylate cyclase domain-containing protein [Verrucomicrobia bacterium]|nr:adenylate/guanylate cyclase domain-containing protein [Verrucomicrobiota bacterium]